MVRPTSSEPAWILATVPSIWAAVVRAASAARWARPRTSSATTAKPLPASPARAASTAAFRASRLVWKEISSMVLTIFWVCSLAVVISCMERSSSSISPSAVATTSLVSCIRPSAWRACSAFWRVMAAISSREALVC